MSDVLHPSFELPDEPPSFQDRSMSDAVRAERERCAKVAEAAIDTCDRPDNPGWSGYSQACEDIAAKIRSGK